MDAYKLIYYIFLNRRKVALPAAPHPTFSHLKNVKPGESLVHNLMYMYEVKIEKMLEKACLYYSYMYPSASYYMV